MWKFIKDGNTVSFVVSWIWKFIRDVYRVSYFVNGCRNL